LLNAGQQETANVKVSLTPEIEKMVAEKIESGEYSDASEVLRQALELLEERDRLIKLRRDVSLGVEQLEQGPQQTVRYQNAKANPARSAQPACHPPRAINHHL
jgi:antitoxin ParD1/3/4